MANKSSKRKDWLGLDNAANMFVASMTSADTKVFRLTCEIDDNVDPEILDQASKASLQAYPLYKSVIRRGFFWYFMEKSDLDIEAREEKDIVCSQIYHSSYRNLLFRVLYRGNRIHLEVFHSLSDGSGAKEFFKTLLNNYFSLLYEGHLYKEDPVPRPEDRSENAFASFDFDKNMAPKAIEEEDKTRARVLRIKGKYTADARQNILELHFNTKDILAKARERNASITAYLTAFFILALYLSAREKDRKMPLKIVISCPVDLRQYYPSNTIRNFFTVMMLTYTFYPDRQIDLDHIIKEMDQQIRTKSKKENISRRVARLVKLEKLIVTRLVPLYIKDLALRLANMVNNLGITGAITNVGRFSINQEYNDKISQAMVVTSAIRPQMSFMSKDDDLTICFSSPLDDSKVQDLCMDLLLKDGLDIKYVVESKAEDLSLGKELLGQGNSKTVPYPRVDLGFNFNKATTIMTILSIMVFIGNLLVSIISNIAFPISLAILFIASAWIIASGILRNRHNPAWIILLQSLNLSIVVIALDIISDFTGLSLSWGLPTIFTAAVLASIVASSVLPRARKNSLWFNFVSLVLAFVPLVIYGLGFTDYLLPSLISAIVGGLGLVLILVFKGPSLISEAKKKWRY